MFREARRRRRDKHTDEHTQRPSVRPAEISAPDVSRRLIYRLWLVQSYESLFLCSAVVCRCRRWFPSWSELFVLHLYECWKFYSSCSALRQICNLCPTLILWSFKWGLNYLFLKLNYCHPIFFEYILFISLIFFFSLGFFLFFMYLVGQTDDSLDIFQRFIWMFYLCKCILLIYFNILLICILFIFCILVSVLVSWLA